MRKTVTFMRLMNYIGVVNNSVISEGKMFKSYVDNCIKTITNMAHRSNIQLKKGIELFCGDGSIYTLALAKYIDAMLGIDINENKGKELIRKSNKFTFVCADAIEYTKNSIYETYDLISIDNPLCVFGKYCEHFDILPYIHNFVHPFKKSLLAFDIVHTPYDKDSLKNIEWINRRNKYYNITNATLELNYAIDFYTKLLNNQGLRVTEIQYVCREKYFLNDYFYMIVCVIEKVMKGG